MCSVAQSCPTLCDPIDCSPLGSYVHGIFQAMILEWVAISFSGESSQHREQTCISLHLLHWQAGSLPLMSPGKPIAGSFVKTKSNMIHKVLPDTHTANTHTYIAIVKLTKNGPMPRWKLFHCSSLFILSWSMTSSAVSHFSFVEKVYWHLFSFHWYSWIELLTLYLPSIRSISTPWIFLIYPISGKIHFPLICWFPPCMTSFPILYRPRYTLVQIFFYK